MLGLEDGIFRGRLEEGKEGGREEGRPCKMVSHKVLCLLFYSVFCNPVRINYNLPAGYGASAVTRMVFAYLCDIAACAAANLAIGTRNGEQET